MFEILEALYALAVDYMAVWGYWGLIVGMALESACFPLPSEIILPFGGYLVSEGILKFWEAVLAGLLGGVLGSTAAYLIGSYGGRPFIQKYGRYILIRERDLQRADDLFARYGNKIVFWARLMPVVRTFISLPAGIARMDFPSFLIYTIAGSLPWTVIFVYAGVKMGDNWDHIRTIFEKFDGVIILALVAIVIFWVVNRVREVQKGG
ncbi:MAG: DedA family protein [Syntrophomonadaceae bacterium]|nr:DedA family protein [Syntrophomonadaceae bacterium]